MILRRHNRHFSAEKSGDGEVGAVCVDALSLLKLRDMGLERMDLWVKDSLERMVGGFDHPDRLTSEVGIGGS
jgi:hypothetical protein